MTTSDTDAGQAQISSAPDKPEDFPALGGSPAVPNSPQLKRWASIARGSEAEAAAGDVQEAAAGAVQESEAERQAPADPVGSAPPADKTTDETSSAPARDATALPQNIQKPPPPSNPPPEAESMEDGTLTKKARQLYNMFERRRSSNKLEEAKLAKQKEEYRSRAVKALNDRDAMKQMRQRRRQMPSRAANPIEVVAKWMSSDVRYEFPPGVYRVLRPVRLRNDISITSPEICELTKNQLVTVAEVRYHKQNDKQSVRARITSPNVGWSSLISTSMRQCLKLEMEGESPQLLEFAERNKVRRVDMATGRKESPRSPRRQYDVSIPPKIKHAKPNRVAARRFERPNRQQRANARDSKSPHFGPNDYPSQRRPSQTMPSMSMQMSMQIGPAMQGPPSQQAPPAGGGYQQVPPPPPVGYMPVYAPQEPAQPVYQQMYTQPMFYQPQVQPQMQPVYYAQPQVQYGPPSPQQIQYHPAPMVHPLSPRAPMAQPHPSVYQVDPEMYGANSRYSSKTPAVPPSYAAYSGLPGNSAPAQDTLPYHFGNISMT